MLRKPIVNDKDITITISSESEILPHQRHGLIMLL